MIRALQLFACAAVGALVLVSPGIAVASDPSLDSPMHVQLQDGSVADAARECGSGDLCGTLHLASGDVISVYSEGSGAQGIGSACNPYKLRVVRMHGDAVVLSYDVDTKMVTKNSDWQLHWNANNCRFRDTFVVFDEGRVKMGVFQNRDGDLSVRFADIPQANTPDSNR